jgi:SAM-dependent methyltransferase
MHYVSPDANRDLKAEIDGYSLQRISRSLPARTYFRGGPLLHIHMHSRAAKKETPSGGVVDQQRAVSRGPLVASLTRTVERLRAPSYSSAWVDYFRQSRFYPAEGQAAKLKSVSDMAGRLQPELVYDLGSNSGLYSQMLAGKGATCIAFDNDAACINQLYLEERAKPGSSVLPLVMDLSNPSPGLGFGLNTTLGLFDRGQADLVLCLALIHHLRVTGNLPFRRIAECLAKLGRWLLIEFVPPHDPAVRLLIRQRPGFDDYRLPDFLESFEVFYRLRASQGVAGTDRSLYLFERRT